MADRKILLTAFGPFAGTTHNPSEQALESLKPSDFKTIQLIRKVLPVAWQLAHSQIIQQVEMQKPHMIVHMGVATQSSVVRLELQAQNLLDFRQPDNAGEQPLGQPIHPHAPAYLQSQVDVQALADRMRTRGQPVEISPDAGLYVCNATYFQSLWRWPHLPTLFVHVPPLTPHWTLAQLLDVLNALLTELAENSALVRTFDGLAAR